MTSGDSEAEALAIAREALHEMLEGTDLNATLVKAATVAALRGDIEDRAWFQFQTADLGSEDRTDMPEDFFRLRRNIDVVPGRDEQRRIYQKAKADFLDSRANPDEPKTIFRGSIKTLDDILRKFELYESEADGRELDPKLVEQAVFIRTIRQRVLNRTERYLRGVLAT